MKWYAEIDKNGIAFSMLQTQKEIKKDTMIPVTADFNYHNKKYENGEWVEYEPEIELQPITEQEQIAIDTALTVEYIACLMEANLG